MGANLRAAAVTVNQLLVRRHTHSVYSQKKKKKSNEENSMHTHTQRHTYRQTFIIKVSYVQFHFISSSGTAYSRAISHYFVNSRPMINVYLVKRDICKSFLFVLCAPFTELIQLIFDFCFSSLVFNVMPIRRDENLHYNMM